MSEHDITCVANDWAKNPRKAGLKQTLTFEVAGDVSSVLIFLTREDGKKIRLNLSKPQAMRLKMEIENACMNPTYGRPELLQGRP